MNGKSGLNKLSVLMISMIILTGIFFRLYRLDGLFFWFDEVHTAMWISGFPFSEVKSIIENRIIAVQDLAPFQQVNPDRGLGGTILALMANDPQHPPLYYILIRLWAGLFGSSTGTIRSFSALSSIFTIPLLYFLCRELFKEKRVALFAVVLFSVSPFHVLYAKEARPYSLWILIIILSNIALLRAIRFDKRFGWFLYFMTTTAGMYTHLMHFFVILAHGFFIGVNHFWKSNTSFQRYKGNSLGYAVSVMASFIVFSPWLFVIISASRRISDNLSWAAQGTTLFHLMGMWAHNYSSIFIDANHSLKFMEKLNILALADYSVRSVVCILILYAVYFLWMKSDRAAGFFILATIIFPMLCLALPDLLFGGIRSGGGHRYLSPCYVGVHISMACLLAVKTDPVSAENKNIWRTTTVFLVICGIFSITLISQSNTWWTKPIGYHNPRAVSTVNHTSAPLLITRSSANLLSLFHLLDSKVRIYACSDLCEDLLVPEGVSDVFMIDPSERLLENMRKQNEMIFSCVDETARLWRWKIR